MTYTLLIRPEAEADMAEARRWYDEQRKGLGDAFLLCVEEALQRIRRAPGIHAVVYKQPLWRTFAGEPINRG